MDNIRVGFALTGSFCTIDRALSALEETMLRWPDTHAILSETAASTDTRFGTASDLRKRLTELTGHPVIDSIREAEPIGPKGLLDVLVIAPCTGNTLAKLAAGVADTAVTMAAKAHLRNGRPVVLAVSTNAACIIGQNKDRSSDSLLSRHDDGQHDQVLFPGICNAVL